MPGRYLTLTQRAVLLTLLGTLLNPAAVRAHRLDAEAQTIRVRKIQIESWFDSGGTPKMARVEVFASDGQLITEGRISQAGTFVFFAGGEPLRVVISAGEGHVKQLDIPAADLGQGADVTPHLPTPDRTAKVSVKDLLIGLAFLLGAGAFALSLWNARQLQKLRLRN